MGSRADLVTENLLLRHQLAVLTCPGRKRPPLRAGDTLVWVLARQRCRAWRRHLVRVRPDTVVRWHRGAWKLFWRWKSRGRLGRPQLSADVRPLVARIACENPSWGCERTRGGSVAERWATSVRARSTEAGLDARPQVALRSRGRAAATPSTGAAGAAPGR